ncbi:MAG: PAS domain-containing protein [Aliishimia sp.]
MDWSNDNDNETEAANPVVDMTEVQSRVRYAPLAQIEGYWNALRGTRMMPQRSEIDPRGLKGSLEYCFVLERIAPGLARMRVAGSHLGDLMGMEVRGMPISSFLTAASREEFGKALEEVFETPSVATIHLTAEGGFGRPDLKARMLIMPVRSDLGDVSRLLGGFITDGEIGRAPRRFNVDMIKLAPISGVDTPRAGKPPLSPDAFAAAERPRVRSTTPQKLPAFETTRTPAATEMSEDASKFEQPIEGVPYLRVVK